jgi:hypothetical protein
MRSLWLQLEVATDVGGMGPGSALAGARLSGTTRGQIRFSDNREA